MPAGRKEVPHFRKIFQKNFFHRESVPKRGEDWLSALRFFVVRDVYAAQEHGFLVIRPRNP